MKRLVGSVFVSAALLAGCGAQEKIDELQQKAQEVQKTVEDLQNVVESANGSVDLIKRAEERRQQRIAKGDTAVMPYQSLIAYLPTDIPGFTREKPEGTNVSMGGMSMSNAIVRFAKTGTEEAVTVQISDLLNSAEQYSAVVGLWNTGFAMESSSGFARGYDIGIADVAGWEKYDNEPKSAGLYFSVGYRFIVSLEGAGLPNTELLKTVAKGLKIQELAQK